MFEGEAGLRSFQYTVPGYQAAVTQDKKIAWDVYVNHYQDQDRARRDPKYVEGKGILYPRAGTLGGCVSVSTPKRRSSSIQKC